MRTLEKMRNQFYEVLTRIELKNVMGGDVDPDEEEDGEGKDYCKGKSEGDSCQHPNGGTGRCEYFPMSGGKLVCNKRNGW